MPRRLLVADRQGTAGPVVVLGSAPVVVVGPVVVGWVLVVVASVVVGAAVVVETVVVGEAVVGVVTGGWVVAPTVENASVIVVASAVADTWAVPGPGALVGLLTARRGLVSAVRVETVGAVVGSRGPVVGVATDLAAGSAGTVSSPRTGVRRASSGWGPSRVAEATRAARTPVVSPSASSPSLQGHRDVVRCRGRDLGRCRGRDVGRGRGRGLARCRGRGLARCRGRDLVRCRGGGVGIVRSRFDFLFEADRAHFLGAMPCRIPLRGWPRSP
jgi:hypothetical protein